MFVAQRSHSPPDTRVSGLTCIFGERPVRFYITLHYITPPEDWKSTGDVAHATYRTPMKYEDAVNSLYNTRSNRLPTAEDFGETAKPADGRGFR